MQRRHSTSGMDTLKQLSHNHSHKATGLNNTVLNQGVECNYRQGKFVYLCHRQANMKFPRYSITTKLLLLFLLVGLSTVLIVGTYSFYSAKKAIMVRTMDQLISVRAVKKQQMEFFFAEKIRNLKSLSRHETTVRVISRRPSSPQPITGKDLDMKYLRNFYLAYDFSNLYLVLNDPLSQRIFIADSSSLSGITPALGEQISWILSKTTHKTDVAITDLFFKSGKDSIPVCLIGCSVRGGISGTPGTVILEIPSTEINRIMLQDNSRIGLGQSGEAYLVGGDLRMRSASRFLQGSILRVPVISGVTSMALKGQTGSSVTDDYRGIRVFSAYEPLSVPGLHWAVIAEIDYEEAMVPVTGLRNDILLVSLIISIFIMGIAQIITKMVTHPIIQLKNAATRLGEGDFNHKVPIRSRDEIGSLAETFNTMSDQLKEERQKRILALFDGQEMERRRISRELHDGLGQKMVGIKLQLENCNGEDHSCLRKTLNETKSGLYSIVEELRRISNDLMPAALDELGLETALRNLCGDIGRQTGKEVEFDANFTYALSGKISVYLFRIAQEGIHNILKHAGAGNISMQLIEARESLIFILEDDGIGFDTGQVNKGNGLSNMRERATLLGGTFSVESEPGKGTTIRVKIPKQK